MFFHLHYDFKKKLFVADFLEGRDRGLDPEAAVTACLDCYWQMLQMMDRGWSDVPLLRVFYMAGLCSYNVLLEGEQGIFYGCRYRTR